MAAAKIVVPIVATVALLVGGRKMYVSEVVKKRAEPYIGLINKTEQQYGIPPGVLFKLLETESQFDPQTVNKNSGAVGIAQFMPATAAYLLSTDQQTAINLVHDPNIAIPLAGKYLAILRKTRGIESWEQALAAYNHGVGNVTKKVAAAKSTRQNWLAYMPSETRNYVAKITRESGMT